MKTSRRKFLKISSLTGIGLAGSSLLKVKASENIYDDKPHYGHFNMCGYAAPKLDVVRIGFIGLGNRGPSHVAQTDETNPHDIQFRRSIATHVEMPVMRFIVINIF